MIISSSPNTINKIFCLKNPSLTTLNRLKNPQMTKTPLHWPDKNSWSPWPWSITHTQQCPTTKCSSSTSTPPSAPFLTTLITWLSLSSSPALCSGLSTSSHAPKVWNGPFNNWKPSKTSTISRNTKMWTFCTRLRTWRDWSLWWNSHTSTWTFRWSWLQSTC